MEGLARWISGRAAVNREIVESPTAAGGEEEEEKRRSASSRGRSGSGLGLVALSRPGPFITGCWYGEFEFTGPDSKEN